MKKQRFLLASLVVALLFSVTAAVVPASAADTEIKFYPNFNALADSKSNYTGTTYNYFSPFYIPIGSTDMAHLKTDFQYDDQWFYYIPGGSSMADDQTGNSNPGGKFYMYSSNKFIRTDDTYDVGFYFTAPVTGTYAPEQFAVQKIADTDGVTFSLYKNDFTDANKIFEKNIAPSAAMVEIEGYPTEIELKAGDKLYFRFNRNESALWDVIAMHPTTGVAGVPDFCITLTSAVPEDVTFPAVTAPEVTVSDGTEYPLDMNLAGDADKTALWAPFYISQYNEVFLDMLVGADDIAYPPAMFSNNYVTDGGTGEAYAGIKDAPEAYAGSALGGKVGTYFVAPKDGKVSITLDMTYEADPTPRKDGMGVTIYKNDLNTVVMERTVVTKSEPLQKTIDSIEVKKNDCLIFVYDKVENIDNDRLIITTHSVKYAVETVPSTPDTGSDADESSSAAGTSSGEGNVDTGNNINTLAVVVGLVSLGAILVLVAIKRRSEA